MAAVSSRKDAGIRIKSERQRILQELILSIEQSNMDALEMVGHGSIELVIVAGHIKHAKIVASVQASSTLLGPATATA